MATTDTMAHLGSKVLDIPLEKNISLLYKCCDSILKSLSKTTKYEDVYLTIFAFCTLYCAYRVWVHWRLLNVSSRYRFMRRYLYEY
jgi:hypothetical protein